MKNNRQPRATSVTNRQTPSALPKDGRLVGRFNIVSYIASGGMGDVWLADDLKANRRVALKILSHELAVRSGFIELLVTEAENLKRLVHPNIVRFYSLERDAELYFIVLEYLPGDSLLSLRGAIWPRVISALLPIAAALAYAHSRGVVHRDLKPGNILLDASQVPRLTDFGIAGLVNVNPESQPRGGGSLPAMSPQQLGGQPPAVADDVYGFGALIYDLISGAPLFTPHVDADQVRHVQPRTLAEVALTGPVPEALDELVASTLHKQSDQRPPDMGSVQVVLENLLSDAIDTSSAAG